MNQTEFTSDELATALRHAYDILDRCMCPFLLLDETLKSVLEKDKVEGDRISLGIKEKDLAESTRQMLNTLATMTDLNLHMQDFRQTPKGFSWNYIGIPIEVKVIKKKYKFLDTPNTLWFGVDLYQIPNPFEGYWKVRQLVR